MRKDTAVYVIVIVVLGAAFGIGRAATRSVPMVGLSFDSVSDTLGPWKCTKRERPTVGGRNQAEDAMEVRLYENADGTTASVTLQVTASRLGVLRDWDTAQVGQGWTLGDAKTLSLQVPGADAPLTMTARSLSRGDLRSVAVTWYVSPTHQAATLSRAEMLGWRDQIAGQALWGELYLQVFPPKPVEGKAPAGDEAATDKMPAVDKALWSAAEDVAKRLAPQLRALLLEVKASPALAQNR